MVEAQHEVFWVCVDTMKRRNSSGFGLNRETAPSSDPHGPPQIRFQRKSRKIFLFTHTISWGISTSNLGKRGICLQGIK